MSRPSYLVFNERPRPGKKTTITDVCSRRSGELLGQIKWYGGWRQYCFFPENNVLFNVVCMRDINAEIESKMAARHASR